MSAPTKPAKKPAKKSPVKPKPSPLLAFAGSCPTFKYGDGKTRTVEFTIRKIGAIETIFDSHENFTEQLEKRPAFAAELAVMALHGARWGGDIEDQEGIDAALKGVKLYELVDLIEAAWWESVASPAQRQALMDGLPNPEAG